MIQKSTELGVTKFLPIVFDRTIVRKINKERLEKVIIEATEQSNRINIPSLEEPQSLNSFLKNSKMDLIFTCFEFLMISIISGILNLEKPSLFNPVLNFR